MTKHLLPLLLVACGGSNASTPLGPNGNSIDQTAIAEQRAATTRGTSPPVATGGPTRCQDGMIASDGPVGGPMENVRVHVTFEGEEPSEVVSDRSGAFHVCMGARKGRPRVHLAITHDGFAPAEADFVFPGDGGKAAPLAITLRRATK